MSTYFRTRHILGRTNTFSPQRTQRKKRKGRHEHKIQTGDSVWSYNIEAGKSELALVQNIFERSSNEFVKLYFDKDSVICTFEHPFFVNNVWKEAKDLKQGDSLFAYAAYKIALDSIYTFRTETATAVYNLEAAGNHNYYVSESGVLVHNCKATTKGFTKSNLKLGQEIHKAYKLELHNPSKGLYKEFNGIKGIRPDFVDFNTRTIYELKPNNPGGLKAGYKQLERYKKAFEDRYGGKWKTVLDKY